MRLLHCLLSEENVPFADEFIQEFISFCVKSLSLNDCPKHQFEGAWSLAYLVSGPSEYVKLVVDDQDAVPGFIKLLSSPSDDLRELAVLALGNIASDSDVHRDAVLSKNPVEPLLSQFKKKAKLSMLRNCLVLPVTRVLRVLVFLEDKYALPYACWALSFISDGSDKVIMDLLEKGVYSRFLALLNDPSPDVQIPALAQSGILREGMIVGNRYFQSITLHSFAWEVIDQQLTFWIDRGLLHHLRELLFTHVESIQREACWIISDITCGNEMQNQALIGADLIEALIHVLTADSDDLKEVAGKTVLKVLSGGSRFGNKVKGLEGFIKPLCDLLMSEESMVIEYCLDALALLCEPKSVLEPITLS
ncbi:OLC1v1002932C1 [Oldenlandia corymbosa var. corymbosa]|uniref:OLC1v1002932C1 n=1 Tax=Oldenlandia corymbosa var. corymbosa TaxID=529605 RepID=A0AAV1D8W4_OLDCO|nr:OLC1v1002932C1 [Oldenlandia corymbosa var. corymbosa]